MVLGLWEGKVSIVLEKTNFIPSEMINGTVKLDLKGPKRAKELYVDFYGERTETHLVNKFIKGRPTQRLEKKTVRVYEFKQVLDGEEEYAPGQEYKFQIKIPEDILSKKSGDEGVLGAIKKVASLISSPSPIKWYVLVSLNLPMSFDISNKLQITIENPR